MNLGKRKFGDVVGGDVGKELKGHIHTGESLASVTLARVSLRR